MQLQLVKQKTLHMFALFYARVLEVIMDEKGLVLLFAFGTPGCSYEYNNLHAIRVALMIVNTSRSRFKRQTGIGIATGNMCTGLIGKMNFR